ncbi:MAG: two-component regulator propeller domain-containing protein [Vicinamibacterales bacterium]
MLTTVDGLPHNMVNAILRDSRGFVWFCTREGLSRFDGHGFVNYGVHDGLPSGVINAMIEVNNGLYWIATSRGLVLFDPSAVTTTEDPSRARRMFTAFLAGTTSEAQFVTSVHRDAGGKVWVGTVGGLYLAELTNDRNRRTVSFNAVLAGAEVTTIAEDANDIWIGTSRGLFTLRQGGEVRRHTAKALDAHVTSMWPDGAGRLWIGTTSGLHRLTLASDAGRVEAVDSFGKADGLPVDWITQIRRSQSGQLWVATNGGPAPTCWTSTSLRRPAQIRTSYIRSN